MNNKFKVIEVVEADAISRNTIFPKNTIISLFNDNSKIKIGDGKTPYNSLPSIGGDFIPASVQTALDAKLTASTASFNAKLTANKAATQANSVAADVATLVTDFNALLAKLKTAGIML